MDEKEAKRILIELSTFDYVKLENGDEAIETVLNLLEKKDKMIDEMAIAIGNEPLPTEEYCIFRNFDCPEVGGNRDCKDCIKQYFERKVENGN